MQIELSIPAMALASARRWGGRTAIVDGPVELSFDDVADQMVTVARALIAVDVGPGDRVAVWAPNTASFIVAALGIQAAGAWLVPLNTRLRGEEAAYILDKVDAAALFAVSGFLETDYVDMLREADPSLRCLTHVIDLPGPGKASTPGWAAFLASSSEVSPDVVDARIASLEPDDISDIMFTSGTTGLPKGAMLRHGPSMEFFGGVYNDAYGLDEFARQLVITPFFHCFGYKAGWMIGLMFGSVTYPLSVFEPVEAMKIVSASGITHMPGSPTMFYAILDHPDRGSYDLSSLDHTLLAASTVPAQLVHRVQEDLGIAHTLTGYGLTENHALCSVSRPDDSIELVATTSGHLVDGLEFRVVDDDGNDVPEGETGELLVKGPLVMSGYYGDPEATATVIEDGWLHTGDIVRVSPDDYVTITDRKKDIYIMGGFNVAPAEVERVLLKAPGVAQVAVVGIPDAHFGEVGAAVVVPVVGVEANAEEIIAYARTKLANYKVPRRVEFVAELPLNATGKVLKHVLRDQLTAPA